MNTPSIRWPRCAGALALCLVLGSCGDDPELVRQREAQKVEISKLEGELALLEEKLEQVPPDRSEDLEKLKLDAETNREDIAKVEAEIEALERKKSEIEKQHEAYRRKYVLR